jgi:hypothetical protein
VFSVVSRLPGPRALGGRQLSEAGEIPALSRNGEALG